MKAWIRGARLDQAQFATVFFGRAADDPVVANLRGAAQVADTAESHSELRDAARHLATAVQAVGLNRWSRFMADAHDRARDPATIAAIETAHQPPAIPKDTTPD